MCCSAATVDWCNSLRRDVNSELRLSASECCGVQSLQLIIQSSQLIIQSLQSIRIHVRRLYMNKPSLEKHMPTAASLAASTAEAAAFWDHEPAAFAPLGVTLVAATTLFGHPDGCTAQADRCCCQCGSFGFVTSCVRMLLFHQCLLARLNHASASI